MTVETVSGLALFVPKDSDGKAVAPKADEKPVPVPLRPYSTIDWVAVIVLMAAGLALIVGTVLWTTTGHAAGGGGFVSKSVVTTGTGAKQVVKETDYSDWVEVFSLTAGATLLLAGCLYGRLRDITLGKMKIDLVS